MLNRLKPIKPANVKTVGVATLNQEKALVGSFSVIVKTFPIMAHLQLYLLQAGPCLARQNKCPLIAGGRDQADQVHNLVTSHTPARFSASQYNLL